MYRPIRKTAFMNYRKCQKKFEYMYKDPSYFNYNTEDEHQTAEQKMGSLFHSAADQFFAKLEGCTLTENIPDGFRDLLPRNTDIDEWFDWFAEIEKERFRKLYKMNKIGLFMPISREIEVKMSDVIDRTGHIDRIDIEPESGELVVVEYKTGRSYNMENKYALTDMNSEVGFYVKIINSTGMFPSKKVTSWMVINPTLKKIWVNKISPITLKNVDNIFSEMVYKIKNNGEFERNVGVLCDYCPYSSECLYDTPPLIDDITNESKEE